MESMLAMTFSMILGDHKIAPDLTMLPLCILFDEPQHFHDESIKWKHFPRNWPHVRGIHRSPVTSPHKGKFSLISAWKHGWVINHETDDFRRYRTHYDVTVMHSWIVNTGTSHGLMPSGNKPLPEINIEQIPAISRSVRSAGLGFKISISLWNWAGRLVTLLVRRHQNNRIPKQISCGFKTQRYLVE